MAEIRNNYTAGTATIANGKNVGFKVGLESKLLTLNKSEIVEGVFYLTSDTHRLFVGCKSGGDAFLSPVNQGVINVSSLPDRANTVVGEFYYLTSSNILCVHNGSSWVQINSDTHVGAAQQTAGAVANNKTTITTTLKDTDNVDLATHSIAIKGGGENKVTIEDGGATVVITDATYGLDAVADGNNVNINLMKTAAGESAAAVEDTVTLVAGTGISLSKNASGVTIAASNVQDAIDNEKIVSASVTPVASNGNGYTFSLKKGDNSSVDTTFDPQVSYGKTGAKSTAHFVNGAANLDVYTTAQVDAAISAQLQSINALTYKGTVGGASATVAALPQTNVEVGDVYMAVGGYNLTAGPVGATETKEFEAGTLFIAQGTEGSNGKIANNAVNWTVVDNYSTDTITNVTVNTPTTGGGLSFSNFVGEAETSLGGFIVDASGVLTAEVTKDDANNNVNVTVKHNLVSASSSEASLAQSGKFLYQKAVVKTIGSDAYGHVTSVVEEAVEVPAEVFQNATSNATVTVTSGVATVQNAMALIDSQTNEELSTVTLNQKYTSDTLALAADSGKLSIDLVWGSF